MYTIQRMPTMVNLDDAVKLRHPQHIVRSTDSVSSIGNSYGLHAGTIQKANPHLGKRTPISILRKISVPGR